MTKNLVVDHNSKKTDYAYVTRAGELCLSNPGQLELLRGMEERGVPLRTTVRGLSMSPFIRDLDVLTISPLNDQRPRIGDIVAFSHPENGRLAIHRIIKRTGSGWVIKGDNCIEVDGVVSIDNIIGRVISIERNKRKVRLGLGASGRLLAFLNCGRGLDCLKKIVYSSRPDAGFALCCLQGLSLYRKLVRRFLPPVGLSEADEKDEEAIQKRLNPGATSTALKPNQNVTEKRKDRAQTHCDANEF